MQIKKLESLASKLAQDAGKKILQLRSEGVEVTDTKSSANDIVTQADEIAEHLIVQNIRQERPNDSIFGEEGSEVVGTTEITWVIDPIDGTVNYLYNLPAYCVSVAACVVEPGVFADGRKAVAAAVYNPTTGEIFTASAGNGAFRNGKQIFASQKTDLSSSLIATGFGYTPARRQEQIVLLTKLITKIRDIRRIGSAAYDLCLLASGRIDGYFEKGIQPWDWAAGALIAQEAGATILGENHSTLPGESMFIAGNEKLATQLQELLAS